MLPHENLRQPSSACELTGTYNEAMRLAWFSPLPPVRTGLAVDSRELLGRLGADHLIDVFVDDPVVDAARRLNRFPESVAIHPAHDFVWRATRAPYDLTVYQLGNSAHHAYQWPYLFRYPGLLVLHDGQLHHSRAAALMRQRRNDDYRAEFAACQPETSVDAAELAIAGFDSHLYYYWPFTRLVVEASKVTAVHTQALSDDLASESPEAHVEYLHLAHGILVGDEDGARRRARVRSHYGIRGDAIVFGCFGGLTPEKRLPQILEAFAAIRHSLPPSVLLFGGEPPSHYDLRGDISRRSLGAQVVTTGYVDDEEDLTSLIAASDVTLNLRWPTARELSGPWLRSLAAGRCSIVSALAHLAGIPVIDAGTWTRGPDRPIAVALDVMDEGRLLPAAMRRLATDTTLREQIGSEARAYWEREHSYERMLDDYRRLIRLAASLPPPQPQLPQHLVNDTSGLTGRLLAPLGVPVPWSSM
jgi:glycosyltransferase involved in cell wall biosynthesis